MFLPVMVSLELPLTECNIIKIRFYTKAVGVYYRAASANAAKKDSNIYRIVIERINEKTHFHTSLFKKQTS